MTNENNEVQETLLASANEAPTDAGEVNFRDLLPEQYRGLYPEFKKPEDFVKSYDELYRKMGSAINPPKDDAPREEWDKFYNKLGRPEDASKYEFEVGEDTRVDDTFLEKFRSVAHDLGITQKQAKDMFSWYNREISEAENAYTKETEASKEKAVADLKARWGQDYERNLRDTQQFAAKLMASDEGYKKIEKFGNDPEFIALMHGIQNKYTKGDRIPVPNNAFVDRVDPATEARRLMQDPDYKDNLDKQRKVRSLYQAVAESRAAVKK